MRQGIIKVTSELLEQALNMSNGTSILDAKSIDSRYIQLIVESSGLPVVEEGAAIPTYKPTITVTQQDSGDDLYTWDWGEPIV